MFYNQELLKKKSPLGRLWLTGNGTKLSKRDVSGIDIPTCCNIILETEDKNAPFALRPQAVLVNGIAVVFARKTQYLETDCELALRRLNDVSSSDDLLLDDNDDLRNITLAGDVEPVNLHSNMFFQAAHAAKLQPRRRTTHEDEDVFLMPSIPYTEDYGSGERRNVRSGRPSQYSVEQEAALMQMEIMEVPDMLPDMFNPDLDMPPPPMDDFYPPEAPLFEEGILPSARAGQQPATAPAQKRRRKGTRPIIDKEIELPPGTHERWNEDWSHTLRSCNPPPKEPEVITDLYAGGPCSGPFLSKFFQDFWEKRMEKYRNPVKTALKTPNNNNSEKPRLKRSRDDTPLVDDPQYLHNEHGMPAEGDMLPNDDVPPMLDDYYRFQADDLPYGDVYNGQRMRGAGSEDIEAERLRAALHGVTGGDHKDVMFQLGLTPASEDQNLSGSLRNRRFSNTSLRTSRRLSEMSSDPETRPLAGLLEEMEGDGDGLPSFEKRPSQFVLQEESGRPSFPEFDVDTPKVHRLTLDVLVSMRSLSDDNELSV